MVNCVLDSFVLRHLLAPLPGSSFVMRQSHPSALASIFFLYLFSVAVAAAAAAFVVAAPVEVLSDDTAAAEVSSSVRAAASRASERPSSYYLSVV